MSRSLDESGVLDKQVKAAIKAVTSVSAISDPSVTALITKLLILLSIYQPQTHNSIYTFSVKCKVVMFLLIF